MKPLPQGPKKGPEAIIQAEIKTFLELRGWFVMQTHGNLYQHGFPDLFVTNRKYGTRWVEVKNPIQYAFTEAQLETFPKMVAHGCGVWILVAATEEEYQKLFAPCNWWHYLSIMNPSSRKK